MTCMFYGSSSKNIQTYKNNQNPVASQKIIVYVTLYSPTNVITYNRHVQIIEISHTMHVGCCWENPFGLGSIEKRSLVKRVLHLDVSTLWVISSSQGVLGVTLLK